MASDALNKGEEGLCRYCNYISEGVLVYHCKQCTGWVHAFCLESGVQSEVAFDNYFDFTCCRCSITGKEVFVRQKLSTIIITYLTLQNLSMFTVGKEGYYEFHENIIKYIVKNWKSFYGKKNPEEDEIQKIIEKVRNVLSASGLFQNGKSVIKQKGWWSLTSMDRSPSYNPYKQPFIVTVRGRKTHNYKGHYRSSISRGSREDVWVRKESEPAIDMFDNMIEQTFSSPDVLQNAPLAKCLRELHGLPPIKQSEPQLDLFGDDIMEKADKKDDELVDVVSMDEGSEKKRRVAEAPEDVTLFYGMAKIIGSNKVQLTTQDIPTDDFYKNCALKPFIKRTHQYKPLMLRLLTDIRKRGQVKLLEEVRPSIEPQHPIDFCYFGPHHLEAVNYLCGQFFWPGIDLLPNLSFSQLTVVAMYKKLVVGFAFMNPEGPDANYLSYFFVRPEWRGGTKDHTTISNFMLYHLIQTNRSMDKTIRLHVSINNKSAYSLYKQFGFITKKIVHDYYKKYIYFNQSMSPHAYYMEF